MDAAGSGHLTASLGYLVPSGHKPFNYMFQPPAGTPWHNCEYEQRQCRIHNARQVTAALGLETAGFDMLPVRSTVGDFNDDEQVKRIYYRELEDLAKDLTGGVLAKVFDHQRRQREEGRPRLEFGRTGDGTRPGALGRVHNDYTESSGPRRLHEVMPEAESGHPFVILNFWRPIGQPVLDTPLALCDARSFPSEDWVMTELIYPNRIGEIYLGKYSEAGHHWYYYPALQPDELLVFKTFDSRLDVPARMTPHCAFDDPAAPPDAPLRRSIEARCIVILD